MARWRSNRHIRTLPLLPPSSHHPQPHSFITNLRLFEFTVSCYSSLARSKLEAPDDFEGGVTRHCTDVLFLLIIVLAWAGMTYLGVDAISNGDPYVLINGIDYDGRICGVDEGVEDKSKVPRTSRTRARAGTSRIVDLSASRASSDSLSRPRRLQAENVGVSNPG